MKKIIIIIVAVLVVAGAAVYFFVIPKPEPPDIESTYVPGDFFVTNIKDSKALLKTTIVLGLKMKEAEKEEMTVFFDEHQAIIRDIIVFTLREKTEPELRSSGIQDTLRTEIVSKINAQLEIDNVYTIYFNDYVLQ